MKHLLMKALLCLSSLLYIYSSSYAQNHYIKANSVAGVEVRQGGGEGSICPTYSSHFSSDNTTDKFYFTSMVCAAAYVKLEVFNLTAGTIKATLTTTYGQAVETKVIATNSSTGVLVIPYDASYNWKFENVATPPSFIADTLRAVANANKYAFPKVNDIAVPANTYYRQKAGQNLTLGTLTAENQDNAFLFRPTAVGTQTVVIELYNPTTNAIVGESNLTIIVTQNCALGITSITRVDAKNYDVAITYNSFVEPYKWEIYNSEGLKLKTGTTISENNPGLKRIFIDDISSGIYDFRLSSLNSNCGVVSKQFSYGNISDVCVMNASATRAGNNYNVTIAPITGVSGIYYTLTNAVDSVITEGIINSGLPLNINFAGQRDGQYFLSLNPANSQKICFQKLSLLWVAAPTVNNRGYLKKYNNVPDYYEMAGIGDYGGAKDAGTGWVVRENRTVMLWQTYVKALSNSPGAKALITFRQDSSSTSKQFSLAFEKGKIKVITRSIKGGANVVSTEIGTTSESTWLRFERNGNNLLCKISDSPPESDNPAFSTVSTINNAFAGWALPFWKGLYVSSGSSTTLATAEFHRFLGGPYTGTSAVVDNTPLAAPVITASNLNPTVNASVVFTSSACKSGYLIQFYKNGVPSYQGSPYSVTVAFGDSYKAKCERGTDKSGFSNTIAFNAPANNQLCGITDGLKMGDKTQFSTVYELKARIFSGKLWLTQSLNTTPESFLVRGANFAAGDFVKTWTGTDFSCFEGQTTGVGGLVEPAGFATPAGYTLTVQPDGARIYSLGTPPNPDNNGGSTTATTFQNVVKNVPTEFQNGKYSPHLFKLSVQNAIPLSIDPVLGKNYPNWAVAWQAEGGNFSTNNTTTVDVGMSFMYDRRPFSNAGYGERCLDYIWENDFNSGQEWANGIDPQCNKSVSTFTSRIPFHQRAISLYGVASPGDRTEWINSSTAWAFDKGVESVSSRTYGHADKVNGRVNTGLANADIEIGLEQGFEDYPKHLAFMLGMANGSQGYVFSQYSAAINAVGADLSYYPDDNGVFPALKKKLDGTDYINGNGGTDNNNIPISLDWDPASKITISGKNITNKGVIDFTNILPCIEISSTSDMTYRHGETYARKNGWAYSNGDLSYSASNPIDNTVVDKFGMNRNTNHIIADIICYGDVNKWWSVNKLNNRKVMLQSKITCDRANMGVYHEAGFTNQALRFKHYDREYGFDIGGFTALTGCEWQIWDRNTDQNLDGYHGAFGVINLMNQRKSFGSASESFTTLKPRLNFLLWKSEISYDGGTNYVKDKATEYVLSENKLPQRQAVSTDGYWVIFAARPEGIEPTSAKFRVTYNGTVYYHTITANDWETVDYDHRNTPLANLPLGKKDYYFTIIKLGSSVVVDGGSAQAPVINSTPTNPTAGTAVTFSTSSQCSGTIKWYSGDAQVSSGLSYTVPNPVANDSYSATCTVGSNTSPGSNIITVANAPPVSGGVTITEPNKSQYFFSNGQAPTHYNSLSNLPAIFTNTNTYDPVNDFVWLSNDKIKVALNLKRGGQIAWASLLNSTTNLVYNGYDGGFQIQLDTYQKPDGYSQNGKYSRSRFHASGQYTNDPNLSDANGPIPLTSYNVTQGGDFNNHSQSLIDYHRVGTNGYYIKIRPIFYTFDNEMSRTYIEVTYTLDGYSVKCDYKYTSFRNDGQYPGNGTNGQYEGGFDSGHAPVCFLVNNLYKFKSYTGNSPWTRDNAGIEDGNLPNESSGQTPLTKNSKERWSLVYNPNTNATIGVYANTSDTENSFGLKQKEVNGTDRPGNEFGGGYTILGRNYDLVPFLTNFDRTNFNKNISSYVVVTPDPATFINEVYRISGH